MELNQRLRRAGGRILLAPELVVVYFARTELGAFLKHNWTNGMWAVLPFAYARGAPVRARHLAPLLLVLTLLVAPWTVVVYGSSYWKEIINFDALVKYGVISEEDLSLFEFADDPVTAFELLKPGLLEYARHESMETPAIAR